MSLEVLVPHARVLETEACGVLSDENRHYLERVLRLRVGDTFTITDGAGKEALASLGLNGSYELGQWTDPGREPLCKITIFCALSKNDRFEWLIEKAVELGVQRIVPLVTGRVVVKPPAPAKLERWRKIAVTAMLQCGGCIKPEVSTPLRFEHLPQTFGNVTPIFLHELPTANSLKEPPSLNGSCSELWLASGPEGGFAPEEVGAFLEAGWKPLWLGKRLFKTDTAPIAALAAMLILSHCLDHA